jgi:hypothetical protein
VVSDPTEKVPQGQRKGEAKQLAAVETGMSHKTADKAVAVTHAIDEAEAAGDVETAADLREVGAEFGNRGSYLGSALPILPNGQVGSHCDPRRNLSLGFDSP